MPIDNNSITEALGVVCYPEKTEKGGASNKKVFKSRFVPAVVPVLKAERCGAGLMWFDTGKEGIARLRRC